MYHLASEILERINDNTDVIMEAIHQHQEVKDACKDEISSYLSDD